MVVNMVNMCLVPCIRNQLCVRARVCVLVRSQQALYIGAILSLYELDTDGCSKDCAAPRVLDIRVTCHTSQLARPERLAAAIQLLKDSR